jgi:hypothetical protein
MPPGTNRSYAPLVVSIVPSARLHTYHFASFRRTLHLWTRRRQRIQHVTWYVEYNDCCGQYEDVLASFVLVAVALTGSDREQNPLAGVIRFAAPGVPFVL